MDTNTAGQFAIWQTPPAQAGSPHGPGGGRRCLRAAVEAAPSPFSMCVSRTGQVQAAARRLGFVSADDANHSSKPCPSAHFRLKTITCNTWASMSAAVRD